jgi:hypothetical protein
VRRHVETSHHSQLPAAGREHAVQCAFWFPIASGQLPQTSGSAWAGASAAEHAAIQSGDVIERVETVSFPTGLAVANMKATLQSEWINKNAIIAGFGPNLYNGIYFDSATGWSV